MNTLRLSLLLASVLALASPAQFAARGEDISQQWTQSYPGQETNPPTANVMAVDPVGNIIVAGNTYGLIDASTTDCYTVKYAAADGAVIWAAHQTHGPLAYINEKAFAVAVDRDGNVFVLSGDEGDYSYHTTKYRAADGVVLWDQYCEGDPLFPRSFTRPAALAVDASGNAIVTGTTYNPQLPHVYGHGPVYDCYTLKYAAADGAVIWSRHAHGPGDDYDFPKAIAVNSNGEVFVTAESLSVNNNGGFGVNYTTYFYTAKFAAADGFTQWEQVHATAVNSFDYPAAMAVDNLGDVIVTGGMTNSYTAKYWGGNGALAWEKQAYNFKPAALALNLSGDPTIAGSRIVGFLQPGSYTVLYTLQYNRSGEFVWEQFYNGADGTQNAASAVAVDSSGNAYVTGVSQLNTIFKPGSYTAKYSALDGSVLWAIRSPNTASLSYTPQHLVLTPDGGAAITGRAYDNASNEYRTIKYAPPDTATLPPVLTSPAFGDLDNTTIHVDYTLHEAAADGTLKLTFDGPVTAEIILGTAQGTADRHQFDLLTTHLTASPEVASVNGAGALVAGTYNVTLSYQDALGHPAATVSMPFVRITTPTPPPTLTAPDSFSTQRFTVDVAFTLPVTALPGSVSLNFGTQTLVLASSQESAGKHAFRIDPRNPTASPEIASGTPIPDDTYTVALRYQDTAINPAAFDQAVEVTILTGLAYTTLAASGNPVPQAGVDSHIVAGSVWTHFGVPVINPYGYVTYRGEWRTPGGKTGAGIFSAEDVFSEGYYTGLLAAKGDTVVDGAGDPRAGLTFKRFDEPVETDFGVAFRATLQGDQVLPANDTALYFDYNDSGLIRVGREGQEMPGAPGSQLAAITSVAVGYHDLLVTGRLRRGPGGITAANDTGAWRWQNGLGFKQVVRTGTALPRISSSPVKSFRLLQTASGSAGTSRGFWGYDVATFEATFANGTSALIDADRDGATALYASGTATVPGLPGAKWAAFGPPATPAFVDGIAFRATLQPGHGGVTANNAQRLFFRAASTVSVARGDAAPGLPPGATFSAFQDPVISPEAAAFAFAGTARAGATQTRGIWWLRDGGPLQDAVAAVGSTPPGLAPGISWAQFTSLAATDFGPIFTARLAGAPAAQSVGLWATDSAGTLRQLIRHGDSLHGKTVADFTVLTAPPGSPGVRRSFTGDGRVVVRVAFTDGSVELVIVTVP